MGIGKNGEFEEDLILDSSGEYAPETTKITVGTLIQLLDSISLEESD